MDRRTKWIGGGVIAAAAVAGGVAWWMNRTEQPDYTLIQHDDSIDVRDYPGLLVAETVTQGLRKDALGKGFTALADYIFAQSRTGEKIAMTAPVLSDGDGGGWRTRFFMPSKYRRDDLPAPGDDVKLVRMPARRVAAIRFSGVADDAMLAEREAELRTWIDANGHRVAGSVEHAFYDAPFVPGPLRRNEVLLPIEA